MKDLSHCARATVTPVNSAAVRHRQCVAALSTFCRKNRIWHGPASLQSKPRAENARRRPGAHCSAQLSLDWQPPLDTGFTARHRPSTAALYVSSGGCSSAHAAPAVPPQRAAACCCGCCLRTKRVGRPLSGRVMGNSTNSRGCSATKSCVAASSASSAAIAVISASARWLPRQYLGGSRAGQESGRPGSRRRGEAGRGRGSLQCGAHGAGRRPTRARPTPPLSPQTPSAAR
jgi:hypothetical protein